MYWNYRVLKQTNKQNESYFEVCEVHNDENIIPHMWGEIMPVESLDELKDDYEYMCKAFERPVLTVVDGKLVEGE